jgi:hypothetical protein
MIDPDAIYSLSEIPDFLPSSYRGKRLTLATLRRWLAAGLFQATCRMTPEGRRFHYVRGSEILKLIGARPTRRRAPRCDPVAADARFAALRPGTQRAPKGTPP